MAALLLATLFGGLVAAGPVRSAVNQVASKVAPLKGRHAPQLCDGDYADALPPGVASHITDASGQPFVFAIRNISTFEHIYYGRDGKLRREYLRSVVHGTGFAYRAAAGETLILTNAHVASRPDVTDEEHTVEGVPAGSKKVREVLKIVRDESDDYEPGHIPLAKAMVDRGADIAVVKAKKTLAVMPFRLGRSGALRPGNLVQVRGFPLGAFAALNSGKVVNPYTEDSEKGWSHADFIIDALLSEGNSGSPVFAVSCRTAEPELVGIFHAGYTDAAALNAVVSIDQLRDEIATLKVPHRDPMGGHQDITAADRDHLIQLLFAEPTHNLVFPFGGRAVQAQLTGPDTLRFSVLSEDYPLVAEEWMVLTDRNQNGFGTLDAVQVHTDEQKLESPVSALEPESREHFQRLYDGLWRQLLNVEDFRQQHARAKSSADAFASAQAARGRLRKHAAEQRELLNTAAFEADRGSFGVGKAAGTADAPPDGGVHAGPSIAAAPVEPAGTAEEDDGD